MNDFVNLEGLIIIPAKNRMAGKVMVIGVGKTEIVSSLVVTSYEDLTSKITVYSDYVVINPGYPPILGNQRRASIFITYKKDLAGRISITPQNRMSGLIEIIEPPIYTLELPSIKDAFVRSNIPTLNYGTEHLMVVGHKRDLNERYRSFIQFDTSLIPENASIKQATLKIYNTTINSNEHQIGIYTAAAPWEETGITWANQPAIKDIIAIENVKETGYVEIDVTEKVIEWYEGREANYGFIIKAMNESYPQTENFITRESSINKPVIEVEYTLDIIYSFGRSELPSSVFVFAVGDSSIRGSLNIREYDDDRDLPARIHIYNFNYWLEANITISRKDVVSNLIVRQYDDNEVPSSILIRKKGGALPHEVVNGKIMISRYFVLSNLKVRRSDKSELPSSININPRIEDYDEIPASLFVLKYTLDHNEILLNITINKKELVSNLVVRRTDNRDLSGNIKTRIHNHNNLNASLIVNKNILVSNLVVRRTDNRDLSGNIKTRIHNNLNASLIVNKNILVGNLKINNYSQVEGNILVKQIEEIPAYITVPFRNDINGNMFVIYASHLPSNITVLSGYLRARIAIPAYGDSVLLGKVTVRAKWVSEIYSSLFVGGDNIPGGYVYIL